MATQDSSSVKNGAPEHIEKTTIGDILVDEKKVFEGDRFGAVAKCDPAEIALVRKLDWYILVSVLEVG